MSSVVAAPPSLFALLAFDESNQLAVRKLGSKRGLPFTGSDLAMAIARLEASFPVHTAPAEYFAANAGGRSYRVFFVQVSGTPLDSEIVFQSIDSLLADPNGMAPSLGV